MFATGQFYVKFTPVENVSTIAMGNANIHKGRLLRKGYIVQPTNQIGLHPTPRKQNRCTVMCVY